MSALQLLLETTVKISALLGPALVVVSVWRFPSAASRHWVLAVAVTCALVLPFLVAVGPTWSAPSYFTPVAAVWSVPDGGSFIGGGMQAVTATTGPGPAPAGAPAPTVVPPGGGPSGRFPVASTLVTVWMLGVGLGLAVLLVRLVRLRWISGPSQAVVSGSWRSMADEVGSQLGLRRPVRLLQSRPPTMLATWGILRPRVVLPKGAQRWEPARIRVVLAHELAHVRRQDWLLHLFGELLCMVQWFNPLAWAARSRLRAEGELACDDEVLRLGVRGPDYATELVDLVRVLRTPRAHSSPAVAMARPSGFERRITAMMNPTLRRQPLLGQARLGVVAAALLLTVPLGILAQGAAAGLSGVVTDQSGRGWADVRLVLVPAGSSTRVATLTLKGDVQVLADEVRITEDELRLEELEKRALSGDDGVAVEIKRRLAAPGEEGGIYASTTDAAGRFAFEAIPPGDYRLSVQRSGFEPIEQAVTLGAGQQATQDIALRLAAVQEHIVVSVTSRAPRVTVADPEALARTQQALATERLQPPVKVRDVAPVYPASRRDQPSAAEVRLETMVTAAGVVEVESVVIQVDPDLLTPVQPEFARAAVEAVRQWQYEPTRLNDVAVPTRMMVTIDFAGS